MKTLLLPGQVDRILRYPRGRSARLARAGKLAHIKLPDGEIRFDQEEIQRLLSPQQGNNDTAPALRGGTIRA